MAEKIEPIINQILEMDETKMIEELTKDSDYIEVATENQDQYDGKHKILEKEDKTVGKGDNIKTVITAKLILTFQKLITSLAVAFLFGRPVKYVLDSDEATEDAHQLILDVISGNKMQYFDRKLARTTMIETRTAEVWFARNDTFDKEAPKSPEDPEYVASKIGVMLLSRKGGYEIYPHYDQYGDMDAFTVVYSTEVFDPNDKVVKAEDRVDIYTKDKTLVYKIVSGGYELVSDNPNPFGKIPVIYYEQETSEWSDVQTLIERYETLISNHADENDYYAAPIIKIKGQLISTPDKTTSGKMLQFKAVKSPDGTKTEYGDAEYLTWENEPASLKLEGDNLKDFIYSLTSSPDISFSSLQSIGALSGIAIKLMFFDATLKSLNHQEVFGAGLMRRISLLKSMLSVTKGFEAGDALQKLSITAQFQDPSPKDIAENIAMLSEALGGEPVLSEKTALANNLLVTDVKQEQEEMEKDRQRQSDASGLDSGSFNV